MSGQTISVLATVLAALSTLIGAFHAVRGIFQIEGSKRQDIDTEELYGMTRSDTRTQGFIVLLLGIALVVVSAGGRWWLATVHWV